MSFWIVIFIIVLLAWANTTNRSQRLKPKPARQTKIMPRLKQPESAEHALEIDWPGTFEMIEQAVNQRNYDAARLWLQKFAYTVVRPEVPQSVRDRFKTLMTAFAREDPMYQAVLAKVLPLAAAEPGILQTALYPKLPGYDEEQIRYVLYFAHELGDLKRLKKGRSYQVFGPIDQTVIKQGEKIGATIATTDIVIRKSPIDERIAALHREATQYKKINWPKSVACLQEAADLMRQHGGGHTLDSWLRLPMFLQQAGRFTESVKEFERLIKETPARIKRESRPDTSATWIEYKTNMDLNHIYNKMRLTYQRERRAAEAARYAAMSEEHGEQADQLWSVLEAEREQKRLAYQEKSNS